MPAPRVAPLVIALDYGGTLTREAAHITGHLVTQVLTTVFAATVPAEFPAVFDSTYRGQLPDALAATAARTGVALPASLDTLAEAIHQETTEHPVDPRAAHAVTLLYLHGVRLLLAANTSRTATERAATLTAASINACFHELLLSCELGAAKPQPEFYRAVLKAADCHPARVWCVGDRLTNDVHGPLAHGMPAVLIDRHGTANEAPPGVPVLTHIDQLPALLDKETQP